MAETNPHTFHLSASSVQAFQACPTKFRLAYREGIRLDEDTDSLRVGSAWHDLHETYQNAITAYQHPDFGLVGDELNDRATEAVIERLNERYGGRDPRKTPEEWALERQQLLISFLVYQWYYQNDDIEYLNQEFGFEMPLRVPGIGVNLPLDEVVRLGHIDHIVRWNGVVGPIERKSTTRDIGPGSDYWQDKQKDTQVSMYALAFRDLMRSGELAGIEGERVGNTIYDVWRRPLTKPKKLTQKDTAEFLEVGVYFDQEFRVQKRGGIATSEGEIKALDILISDERAEVEIGKSGKPAIRETIEMYGARLMHEMTEDPERYFQRQEIARTERDLDKFERDLYNIYRTQRMMDKAGAWYENAKQCRSPFPCPFIPICYGRGADAVCDGKTTPPGFRRIFDLAPVEGDE